MIINLGNERVFLNYDDIYYLEKHGRDTLIHCVYGKLKTRDVGATGVEVSVQDIRRHRQIVLRVSGDLKFALLDSLDAGFSH
ncbi:hypothetical protein L9W92_06960 [Pelotomaculum terephthalicicum JT]|nr:hypothetical protein [Pelotomaculum terephthalicicum]MCG9967792.1 hypothetical protein [Pelotomaculum terephthalicicum JT]